MSEPKVRVFFYGSYMNRAVLREVGLVPESMEVARLDGYDLRIEPRANLMASSERCVYGVLVAATHAELARLYAHAQDVLGERYLPHPILVQTQSGMWVPALCYIAPSMVSGLADPAYVDRILQPARELGFPEWYVRRVESHRPGGQTS